MFFNSAASSTLFLKVNFKRTPYANTIVSLRIIANVYEDFNANKTLFLVDLNPDTVTLAQVNAVVESLRIKANAAKTVVKMPQPVFNKLSKQS